MGPHCGALLGAVAGGHAAVAVHVPFYHPAATGNDGTTQGGPSSSGSRDTPTRASAKLARELILQGSPSGGKARKLTVDYTAVNVTIHEQEDA